MAQATDATTAAARPAAASAKGRSAKAPGPGRYEPVEAEIPMKDEPEGKEIPVAAEAERNQSPDMDEPFRMDAPDGRRVTMLEAEGKESPVNVEAGHPEPPVEEEPSEDDEDEEDEPDETEPPASGQALAISGTPRSRVQALLAEALRLGEAHHLIERRADGSFALPGQTRQSRATSDCTCPACGPHDQRHWWCVVCGSGAHDWLMVKPQYERQTLKPGGIEGARQAACSAQCARDFLASLGRQPVGVPTSQTIDPSLAVPG